MADLINRCVLALALSFWTIGGICQSNEVVLTGRVTDKESGAALQGISVYINNTTYSTQTQKDGSFRLSNIPLSNFELVFSSVNYETQTLGIDIRTPIAPLNIQMQKSTALLNEVVVTANVDKNGWAQYGTTFSKDFLSYSSFAQQCKIVNYPSIRFRRIKKDNILKAYSKEPLKIKNNALGYELTYWLNEYEHQFATQLVLYQGNTQFNEMRGSKRKMQHWDKNRQIAYRGSLTHFIRSVYEGNTKEEGFVVNLIKTIPYKDINFYIPAFTDTTSIHSSAALTNFIAGIYTSKDNVLAASRANDALQWLGSKRDQMPFVISLAVPDRTVQAYFFVKKSLVSDQVAVYRFDVKDTTAIRHIQWETAGTIIPDQKSLNRISGYQSTTQDQRGYLKVKLFYSRPLNPNHFISKVDDQLFLHFNDTWQITYTREGKDKAYIEENALQNNDSGYQESTLSMTGSQPVMILPNGYYTGTYSFITGAYWSYEKVDKMLPLDFKLSK
ncbi:carboxypeptidase-like regulatory domain-containing protein [Niabella yanshanensis]|uniref:Carboxypeptidase-like regulatory domain-containing protein n=1 Tax=Niabella yanshanensis TaxID=577386 RepID=A0ABZ0WBJ2_9BACT|nr:carboxypeptidase-like regulatory domain-containing protein [Niabella yanshanensis]WQD39355.1 carboxypeptidase-like regulatory domain-containing protein [Niabella yanshanensis]